jgi:hypothetical protein
VSTANPISIPPDLLTGAAIIVARFAPSVKSPAAPDRKAAVIPL